MDISDKTIDGEYFTDIHDKTARNADLAVFYDNLFADTDDFAFNHRARAIRVCCKWWDMDYYRLQQIKDIKRVNLCKDKFCFNCQSMLAIKRQSKYAPMLDALYNDYTVCHMVVTVPNCYEDELLPLLEKMYLRFKHLTRFLSGNLHIRGIDFAPYGYAGGIRALEVTKNAEGTYHPHFHCMILFRKGLTLEKTHTNSYSFDNGLLSRKFSQFEISLQKIWRLLIEGEAVTREKVNNIKEGYSITIDPIRKGEYHEAFKYACKGAFKDGTIYDEKTFRALFYALKNRRMIQGYGVLHNFKDEETEILEEDLTQNYEEMIAQLRELEEPIFKAETLEEILRERNCKYISKKNLKRLLIAERQQTRKNEEHGR